MRRTRFIGITGAAVAAVVLITGTAGPAWAKGPSEGTITGEGIDAPISVLGEGTPSGGALIDQVGFFPATFRQIPDPMLATAPTADLGPSFVLAWVVPGPDDRTDTIRQVLYPYAAGGPLVSTEPGQSVFGTERTKGGWYRAPAALLTTLRGLGLPAHSALAGGAAGSEPSSRSASSSPWAATMVAVAAITLLIGLVASSRRGRRTVAT